MAQLIVQTAYPGDLLLSIPLLKQIRNYYPDEKIVLLCRAGLGELFLREHLADEVLEVNKKDKASLAKTLRDLRSREWDRVFCPHESYRSAWWVRSLKVKEFSVGFAKWWNGFAFTKRAKRPMQLPDALRQLSLLKEVNPAFKLVWETELVEAAFENRTQKNDVSYAKEPKIPEWASMTLAKSGSAGKTAYLAPGSVWPTKQWDKTRFAELAKILDNQGYDVAFVGSPSEKELCDQLARETNTTSLAGKTSIPDLIELFKNGKVLVSNDSGAMHAASVAGLPTVAIFGPTVLGFGFRPWQSKSSVVQMDLKCRPCAAHGSKKCPIGTHECMKSLPATRVASAIADLVGP